MSLYEANTLTRSYLDFALWFFWTEIPQMRKRNAMANETKRPPED